MSLHRHRMLLLNLLQRVESILWTSLEGKAGGCRNWQTPPPTQHLLICTCFHQDKTGTMQSRVSLGFRLLPPMIKWLLSPKQDLSLMLTLKGGLITSDASISNLYSMSDIKFADKFDNDFFITEESTRAIVQIQPYADSFQLRLLMRWLYGFRTIEDKRVTFGCCSKGRNNIIG